MKAKIVLITGARENGWTEIVCAATAPLGVLEIVKEERALKKMLWDDYDLVIIDASHIDDVEQLIAEVHQSRIALKLVIALAAPRWRVARDFFRAGVADCIPKSLGATELRAILKELLNSPEVDAQRIDQPEEEEYMKEKILLIDNDPDFLDTRTKILERAGYFVFATDCVAKAQEIIEAQSVDAAIVDNRLLDNLNPDDRSGMNLALQIEGQMPVILLTDFPDFRDVRQLLRNGNANISYLSKTEGQGAMLNELERQLKRRIFIVHGHDNALRETVARFIDRLQFHAIILDEQPASGLTIIEKFERYSNVSFVVVLLTPDDRGGPFEGTQAQKPRARQNVIFELGYFLGKLGRRKVCALYVDEVELPSDFKGVEYLPVTATNAWKLSLARAMKQAGLEVDLNRAA